MRKDPGRSAEKTFLSRWSRRKSGTAALDETAVAGAIGEPPGGNLERSAALPAVPGDDAGETKILADEDMPPIESLTEHSDFSGFLSPGVSEGLRKMALRKLFNSATFNIRDGLDDYDDDFRNFAALGDLITCDMKHQMELAEERKRRAAEAEAHSESAETEQAADDETQADSDPRAQENNTDAESADTESVEAESANAESADTESAAADNPPADDEPINKSSH